MKERKVLLLILDGFGINPSPESNAVAMAKMPHFRSLLEKYPHTELQASENFVGLPKTFMGNSEVGHLNIGAGRIVYQDFSLISRAIEEGTFDTNPVFLDLFKGVTQNENASLHLMGLVSDGGVHSHISHLFALLKLAKKKKVPNVWIHVFTDGRDTSPTSGKLFVEQLQNQCKEIGVGKIATVSGRFYAMDRDKRWERTEAAYDAIVAAQSKGVFTDPLAHIEESYRQEVTDEFISPAVSSGYTGISAGDGILFFNFRADRARQLSRALTQKNFDGFSRKKIPALSGFVAMTPYDESMPLVTAYEKPKVKNTLGEVVSRQGWKQLRIAETEKYAHVTYFFSGGDEKTFQGEKRILIPSPRDVKTYDLKPEMSVQKVTEQLLTELNQDDYQLTVLNFANPDMVGHTGSIPAAVKALETVDTCLGQIIGWCEKAEAVLIVTADHGNCEMMRDEKGEPLTSHTLLPVPFILGDQERIGRKLHDGGRLCDIAPTILKIWNLEQPVEMTGTSLIDS